MDRGAYLAGMRRFAGTVTVVTTGKAELRRGLTATAVTSVSADPPTLLVCVNRDAEAWQPIVENGVFVVNVLNHLHADLAIRFGSTRIASGAERFQLGEWRDGQLGAPVLADSVVSFECRITAVLDAASHAIVVGQVEAVHGTGEIDPLLWLNGGFASPGPLSLE